jgi:hypothetical protein
VVEGDDLSDGPGRELVRERLGAGFDAQRFVCANAYQGAMEIAAAIRAGAQVVVTGRVADPSLVLGPAVAHFGWSATDWDRLAGGTMAGHLLECGAQVTGGYFADPGRKDVPGTETSASRSRRSPRTAAASSRRRPAPAGWWTAAR